MFDGPIALNVKFVLVNPERDYDNILNALKIDQHGTNTNEGLQFFIGKDVNAPNTILYTHEQYSTLNELNTHNTSKHVHDIFEMVGNDANKNEIFQEVIIQEHQCTHEPMKILYDNSKDDSLSYYCLNIESNIKSEYREEFIQLMTLHQQHSKNEIGCIQFDWGISSIDPNTFYQHQQFKSYNDLQFHETTEHFHKFMKFNKQKDPYTKPQTVDKFTLL